MKEIRAYIKPHKLSEVTLALHGVDGLTGMSVIDACGFGRRHKPARHEKGEDAFDHVACTKLEIVCSDELANAVVATILKHAHTGLKGDGKIYVYEVQDAIRISTGEHGRSAI
ncbi:MAG: P-II family nitrogen regulator [Candidatus Hydrogenedentes bacterium]|nr:P-II family nitrogen regulator [Candidatus Hydrogenedentota bacterium]